MPHPQVLISFQVFVRNIDPPRKGGLAVDHNDFSVVPVVEGPEEFAESEREEGMGFDPGMSQSFPVGFAQGEAPDRIVEQADFHPLRLLPGKEPEQALCQFALFKDVILQMDRLPGRFKGLEDALKGLLPVLEEGGLVSGSKRKSRMFPDDSLDHPFRVPLYPGGGRLFRVSLDSSPAILGLLSTRHFPKGYGERGAKRLPVYLQFTPVPAYQQVEQDPPDRKRKNRQEPGQGF